MLQPIHAVADLVRVGHCHERPVAQRARSELLAAADDGDDGPSRGARVRRAVVTAGENRRQFVYPCQFLGAASNRSRLHVVAVPEVKARVLERARDARRRPSRPEHAQGLAGVVGRGRHVDAQRALPPPERVRQPLVRQDVQRTAPSERDSIEVYAARLRRIDERQGHLYRHSLELQLGGRGERPLALYTTLADRVHDGLLQRHDVFLRRRARRLVRDPVAGP
mmetsp:Transcript_3388/g.8285  ORF Transcript_3388/g.8285 Transcript_3388/m.8285 type:complete len:223 (-) Transcript_3388:1024-1692(-)